MDFHIHHIRALMQQKLFYLLCNPVAFINCHMAVNYHMQINTKQAAGIPGPDVMNLADSGMGSYYFPDLLANIRGRPLVHKLLKSGNNNADRSITNKNGHKKSSQVV
jgi:hypothetical protein